MTFVCFTSTKSNLFSTFSQEKFQVARYANGFLKGRKWTHVFKTKVLEADVKDECGMLFPTHNIHLHTWWWTKHTFFCEIYPWKAKNRVPIFIAATHSCSKCNHFNLEVSMPRGSSNSHFDNVLSPIWNGAETLVIVMRFKNASWNKKLMNEFLAIVLHSFRFVIK